MDIDEVTNEDYAKFREKPLVILRHLNGRMESFRQAAGAQNL